MTVESKLNQLLANDIVMLAAIKNIVPTDDRALLTTIAAQNEAILSELGTDVPPDSAPDSAPDTQPTA